MGLFRQLGRKVERFTTTAKTVAEEHAGYQCDNCGARFSKHHRSVRSVTQRQYLRRARTSESYDSIVDQMAKREQRPDAVPPTVADDL